MLEVDGLTKRYGTTLALSDLSFSVRPGEVYGFVGANGAGKTTAMRIMLGVLAADSGIVRWQGKPVTFETRRRFGYMPEERGLYPKMRVTEHLVYLARLHGLDVGTATRSADALTERLGVAERRNDAIEKLSLGNQQRVQLAAALVHDPEVLVLDEPFSGLDPVGVDALAGVLLERARRGVPVVFSSHQLDLVERLCDSVGIINAGRMVASGTVEDLRAQEGRRQLLVIVRDAPVLTAMRLALPYRIAGLVEEAGATAVTLKHEVVSRGVVERCHELGVAVLVWTVNDRALFRRLDALGVDGVISDDPLIFQQELGLNSTA